LNKFHDLLRVAFEVVTLGNEGSSLRIELCKTKWFGQ